MAYYCTKIKVPYRRITYSLSQCWVSEYIEHSEHLSNNGTIAERVADSSEPSGQLEYTNIVDKLPARHITVCMCLDVCMCILNSRTLQKTVTVTLSVDGITKK